VAGKTVADVISFPVQRGIVATMEIILEVLWQIFGELLLQVAAEMLVELGIRSLTETLHRPQNPIYATIGYILWGAFAGAVSLLIFPSSAITDPKLRWINLVVTPALVGAMMVMVGKARSKKGQDLIRLDRFGYAFVFAFVMSLVRFVWAH